MLIDNKEVQLSDFTVDTDINKVSFKQSSGRTSYRSRSLSYRSKLSLEFEDADTATEFVEDITALEVIPMVLEENDISPYGDELEVSGGTIPAVYEYSFIGNGTDSYMEKPNNIGGSASSIALKFNLKLAVGTRTVTKRVLHIKKTASGNEYYALSVNLKTDGFISLKMHYTDTQNKTITSTTQLIDDVEYNVCMYINFTTNTGKIFLDGVLDSNVVTTTGAATTAPIDFYSEINIMRGTLRLDQPYTFVGGEISELYLSTNVLAIDCATIEQYATMEEHFTQTAPDALVGDWFGGWAQGSTEISPEIPGAEILNFYLERAPTFKVDGYNNVTVELRTLLSKDNITYPTTYNSTILDTLPYDWKYRENIYTQFNNNTTLAGINYNTQNSTTGRSLRLQFRLLKTEYLELRKFIFNKRYTPFAYNSLVGGFSVDTMMVIGNYSMSFTGKLYNITLILEEQ